eukprot:COSAG01_NODE_54451_length_332_cov_0.536481_1_plen_30_part_10
MDSCKVWLCGWLLCVTLLRNIRQGEQFMAK